MIRDLDLPIAFVLIILGLALLIIFYFALTEWADAVKAFEIAAQARCPPDKNCFCFDCPTPEMDSQWAAIGIPMILVGAMLVLNKWWNLKE